MLKAYALGAAALCSSPVLAEIPQPVVQMLDEAIAGGDMTEVEAVAKYARKAVPDSITEIDHKVDAFKASVAAAQAAKLAEAEEQKRKLARNFFKNWTGQGELGGFVTTGNSDTKGVSAGLALSREAVHWRLNLRANADYQRSNGVTSNEQFSAAIEPNYKFNERFYAYGLGQWDRDRPQGIDTRYLVSGGLGYRAIATDTLTVDVKAGPAWRRTNFTSSATSSALTGLASTNVLWKLSPTMTLSEAASYLWQSHSATLFSLSAIDAKISGALSARLSYQVRHETDPPTGVEKTDTLSRMTLVYGF